MNIKNVLYLGLGIVVGGAVAYKLTAEAVRRMTDEELTSMQEYYECKMAEMEPVKEDKDIAEETEEVKPQVSNILHKAANKPPIEELMAKAEEQGYVDYSTKVPEKKTRKNTESVEEVISSRPRIISPSEYAMADDDVVNVGYEWYEGNKILVDEKGEIIDPHYVLGIWPPEHFDIMPDDPDTIYMRNDKLKIDIEIIRIDKDYEK